MILPAACSDKQGFALLELLFAIAILALVAVAAAPLYGNLQVSTQLGESSSELTHTLREARTRATARLNDASHGVYLQSNQYTLYQGASFASRNTSHDRVVQLDSALTLSNTITGNEINFSKGLGVPNNTGTITLTHDVQGSTTITIDSLGSIQR